MFPIPSAQGRQGPGAFRLCPSAWRIIEVSEDNVVWFEALAGAKDYGIEVSGHRLLLLGDVWQLVFLRPLWLAVVQ